jgi:Protein of unknown function (DUF1552)
VSSYRIARRSFLRGCGAATLMLPLLRNIEARAQGMPAPLRFLVLHHPLGTQINLWRPTDAATTSTFTLPAISAPFAPLQSKMIMIDGLNLVSATRIPGEPNGDRTHESGMVALMTGVPSLGRIGQQDHAAGGRSIDQLFLDQSPLLGGKASMTKTPFGSLQLAADIRSDRDEVSPRVLSYLDPAALPAGLGNGDRTTFEPAIAAARRPLYPETQPLAVYNRIFASALGADDFADQQSVLGVVRGDLARMQTLIPSSEKDKLGMYADAIQKLESSLQGSTCAKPSQPQSFVQSGKGFSGTSALSGVDYYDPADPNNHPHQAVGRLHFDMIRAAFACDLVRVATFMWSAGTNWVVFPAVFGGATFSTSPQAHHPPSHTTNTATLSWLAQIDLWYAQETVRFLQILDSTPDLDGNSLLDNTVVAYVTEVGRAYDHDWRNVPFLLFGGKNTRLKTGQFIKVTDGKLAAVEGTYGGSGPNRNTNDVWLALAPIFGVNLPSLGASTQYMGPLPGITTL